jgi:hypothetical protein
VPVRDGVRRAVDVYRPLVGSKPLEGKLPVIYLSQRYVRAWKNPDGTVKTWNFEMASTLALERAGWTRKTLPVGTEVTIGGFGGRAVTERAIAAKMVTADGKELFVGKPGQ